MQYRRPPRTYTPEAIENMRFRYEETDEPQESIAADYGIHRKTLDRIAKDEGWTLRKNRLPIDVPPELRLAAEADQALRAEEAARLASASRASEDNASPQPEVPSASLSIADRLEKQVETQLAAVERKRMFLGAGPESVADGEKSARTLASLTDTMHKIRRLRCPDAPIASTATPENCNDDLPADIDQFRLALARRIEAFVRSRTDIAVPATGDASGGSSSGQ